MAVRGCYVIAGLWLSLICDGFCFAQEADKVLSAEEIVARHEATWGKLKRIRFELETKTLRTSCATSTRISGDGKQYQQDDYYTTELHVKGSIHLDGDRVSSRFHTQSETLVGDEHDGTEFRQARSQNTKAAESRELIDSGLIITLRAGNISIATIPNQHPRQHDFLIGRGISRHFSVLNLSLRDWVAEARPTISMKVAESGANCWVLAGKFKTNITPTQSPSYRTDDVAVTINADRGYRVRSTPCAFYAAIFAGVFGISTGVAVSR